MIVEPIGLATCLVGLVCMWLGGRAAVFTLAVTAVFGSAAAIFIGSANIQPGHVFLAFLALACLTRRREVMAFIRTLHPNEPGFWFACLVMYGVASAFLLPRILAGLTEIIPLGTSIYDDTGSTVPLTPVSTNLTQSVYLTANLFCFAMTAAIASTRDGFTAVLHGLIAYCAASIAFAVIDMATYATGTQGVLGFMRNAKYVLHTAEEVDGMKRVVGSFTEAASFARSTLGVLGLTGTLWLRGYRPALNGTLAAASVAALVLSTSSTGLIGAPIVLVILYATALSRLGSGVSRRNTALAVIGAPPLLFAVTVAVMLEPAALRAVHDYLNLVVLDKSTSDSGFERSSWNAVSFQNFLDSWGIGVGLGTARASSFVIALLATVGLPGAVFYAIFLADVLLRRRGVPGSFPSDVRLAARNGCLGLLIGDLLVSPVIDQGLFFCMLAAIASAKPEKEAFSYAYPRPLGARA